MTRELACILLCVGILMSWDLMGVPQKPTLTDVMKGQADAAQTATDRSTRDAANQAVAKYKALRDQQAQIHALTAGLKELQDARDASEAADRKERQAVADAAEAAHTDTIRQLKTFGFSLLAMLFGGVVTLAAKYRADKIHQNGMDKKVDSIKKVVDGEKTAAMKIAVASLKSQLLLLQKLSPDSTEVIAMLEAQIEERDQELVDRAVTMAQAARIVAS